MDAEKVKTTIIGIKMSWKVRESSIAYLDKFSHELMRRILTETEQAMKEECGIYPLPIEIVLATEETLDSMRWEQNYKSGEYR